MDNLTHSLIGVTLGKTLQAAPGIRHRSEKFRAAVLWASVIGNNLPDLDGLGRWFASSGGLSYLLQHRGYTHTITVAPLEALATMLLAALFTGRWLGASFRRREWVLLYLISLFSIGTHIGADYWNDYGVHPFAPFGSHAYYGGRIFIVEPLLWASMLPLVIFGFRSAIVRGLGGIASVILLGLAWFSGVLSWPISLAVTLDLALMLFWQWKRPGILQPLASTLFVLSLFWNTGNRVERLIRLSVLEEHPEERITQLVTTPAPGNPFCWKVISVSILDLPEDGSSAQSVGRRMTPFFERLGGVSFFPGIFPPESCYPRLSNPRTAPLMKTSFPVHPNIFWVGEFRGTSEELEDLTKSRCRLDQFLRFARAPYWKKEGDILIAGDLRYDNEPGLSFAEFPFPEGEACLSTAPNWEKPSGLLPSHR